MQPRVIERLFLLAVIVSVLSGCTEQILTTHPNIERETKIPADAVKITPETDLHPPKISVEGWQDPLPLPYPISTAGAEDSPFIMPDGKTL